MFLLDKKPAFQVHRYCTFCSDSRKFVSNPAPTTSDANLRHASMTSFFFLVVNTHLICTIMPNFDGFGGI